MALLIQAVNMMRPRLKLGLPMDMDQVVEYIAGRTTVKEGEIHNVLLELRNAVVHFARNGHSVTMEGMGCYVPKMSLKGKFGVSYRVNRDLLRRLNSEVYKGIIQNRDRIGMTPDELVELWNEENPDNPVA